MFSPHAAPAPAMPHQPPNPAMQAAPGASPLQSMLRGLMAHHGGAPMGAHPMQPPGAPVALGGHGAPAPQFGHMPPMMPGH